MNRGRFTLLLTAFMLAVMGVGNITASCRQHRVDNGGPPVASSVATNEGPPACTSTVSCPTPGGHRVKPPAP